MGDNIHRQHENRKTLLEEMSTPTSPPSSSPLSPQPLLLARPPIRCRASLTSIKKMPMISEDSEGSILASIPHRRTRPHSTGVFYRYGEDYITPWHLVGIPPSPTPTAAAPPPSKQEGQVRDGTGEDPAEDWELAGKLGKRGWRRLRGSRYWSWL